MSVRPGSWQGFEKHSSGSGVIVCIFLLLALTSCGCLQTQGSSLNRNLTAEDRAFLNASEDLPMGKWDAANIAEIKKDYQDMYLIAKTQKEVYEKRMQGLESMPVSDQCREIKNEYRLADEYGMLACECEMNRALAFMESNYTGEEYYWNIENNAMDESLKHLMLAKNSL